MLFKPAIYRKYCKRCKFVASVGRPKARKPSALGGLRPLTPHRGLCPLDPRWGLRRQTPVIGSRYRARHVPLQTKFLHLPPAGPTFNLTHVTPLYIHTINLSPESKFNAQRSIIFNNCNTVGVPFKNPYCLILKGKYLVARQVLV